MILGKTASKNYSEQVFKNNLKVAIINAIRKPPAGFKEAVNLHFYLKRDQLIKVIITYSNNILII